MSEMKRGYFRSPIGPIEITATRTKIISVTLGKEGIVERSDDVPVLLRCIEEMDQYFKGTRRHFTLPLDHGGGTEFQQKVWKILLSIPFGKTVTYGEIAKTIGMAGAARAVGGACHANPLAVLVPCHRVLGANGDLTGFGGGLWRKKWLLHHEQKSEQE